MRYSILNTSIVITIILIAFSPFGRWIESTMVSHVLFELPLLVVFGTLLGVQLNLHYNPILRWINSGGIFGILTAVFTLAFWMIPRWLDASLNDPLIAYAKYVSMLFVGMSLAMSWPGAHVITRALVKIEFLTMLYRLGWIYLISPERLCNNYLLADQKWLGSGFLLIGLTLSISWMLPVFFGSKFGSIRMSVDH